MRSLFQRLRANQFARFLLTGGTAAGVNIVSRWLFSNVMSYSLAIAAAYLCGMTTAWLLSRLYVFEPSGRTRRDEYVRFTLVNLVAAAQVWLISIALADYLFPAVEFTFYPEDVAHIVGVIAPIFTSYVGHKHFSFARAKRV